MQNMDRKSDAMKRMDDFHEIFEQPPREDEWYKKVKKNLDLALAVYCEHVVLESFGIHGPATVKFKNVCKHAESQWKHGDAKTHVHKYFLFSVTLHVLTRIQAQALKSKSRKTETALSS